MKNNEAGESLGIGSIPNLRDMGGYKTENSQTDDLHKIVQMILMQ